MWYNIIITIITSSGIIGILTKAMLNKLKKVEQRNKALELGVQALLIAEMIGQYEKYRERKHCPIYAKENFENMWVQYESLGANGVMSEIHGKFMALPE